VCSQKCTPCSFECRQQGDVRPDPGGHPRSLPHGSQATRPIQCRPIADSSPRTSSRLHMSVPKMGTRVCRFTADPDHGPSPKKHAPWVFEPRLACHRGRRAGSRQDMPWDEPTPEVANPCSHYAIAIPLKPPAVDRQAVCEAPKVKTGSRPWTHNQLWGRPIWLNQPAFQCSSHARTHRQCGTALVEPYGSTP
jgi:hypothetical protein